MTKYHAVIEIRLANPEGHDESPCVHVRQRTPLFAIALAHVVQLLLLPDSSGGTEVATFLLF